jgi:hypothetical protein
MRAQVKRGLHKTKLKPIIENAMAHETELLYVVTLLIFIVVCDLIITWMDSRRKGNPRN